jgi:hypothetical protein
MYSIQKFSGMLLSLELLKHFWIWMAIGQTCCNRQHANVVPICEQHFQYNMHIQQLSWKGSVPSQMAHLHNVHFKVVTAL